MNEASQLVRTDVTNFRICRRKKAMYDCEWQLDGGKEVK